MIGLAGFEYRLQYEIKSDADFALSLDGGVFQFGAVREESLLSSWPAPNWIVEGSKLRQMRSRTKEREIRRRRMIEECGSEDPYVLIQYPPTPTLAFGEWCWRDYELETSIVSEDGEPAGVAFRYQDARHYYALMIVPGKWINLVVRQEDEVTLLDRLPISEARGEYAVSIRVEESHLTARIDEEPALRAEDTSYPRGKVALLCEGESVFGPVRVTGTKMIVDNSSLPDPPEMLLLAEGTLGSSFRKGRILLDDLDGDGFPEMITDDDFGNTLHCGHLNRGDMWEIGPFRNPLSRGGDIPFRAFDIDGDGRNEIVLAGDFGIHVHQADTGAHRVSISTPKANPYRENADYPHELLLADALCPMRVLPGEPPGFYVKDRYWNIWVYDHRLNLLWHRALNTGHFPLPIRFDDDPRDYLFAGRTMLSPDGEVVWSLGLPDHSDAVGFFALNDKPRLYVAAGEEGLLELEPRTGEICTQLKYGHVQQYSVGRFSKERSEYQLLATTLWREPGICYVLDKKLDLIGRWREMATDLANYPIPWGTDGRDLIVDSGGIRDPFTGELLRPLPDRIGRVRKLAVLDLPKYGPGYLFVINEEQWQLWGAGSNVPAREPRNRPNALVPTSYLPILDL